MTADIVNLRRARKSKARAECQTSAAANRAAFGRTTAEKEKDAAARALASHKLDGHRRDREDRKD